MTGQQRETEPLAPRPDTNAVTSHEALVDQAVQLGRQHRDVGTAPFGDASYVYWDEGSAHLLNALDITSPTTNDNVAWRERLVGAYCEALKPTETGEVEPDSWWHPAISLRAAPSLARH
jgi:hypothetical protein